MIIGVLRWGWVEVILQVRLEVILHHLLRQSLAVTLNLTRSLSTLSRRKPSRTRPSRLGGPYRPRGTAACLIRTG